MAAFVGQMLVFATVLTVFLFLPPILAVNDADTWSSQSLEAARQMLAPHDLFWPALGVAFVLVILLALRMSHRIAGPLYRFQRLFECLLGGEDPGPVRIRKRDYLKPEAELFDRVIRSVVEDRERLASLEESLRLCLEEIEAEGGPGAASLVARIRRQLPDAPAEGGAT